MDSPSSVAPKTSPPIVIAPKPMSETRNPVLPSVRYAIVLILFVSYLTQLNMRRVVIYWFARLRCALPDAPRILTGRSPHLILTQLADSPARSAPGGASLVFNLVGSVKPFKGFT